MSPDLCQPAEQRAEAGARCGRQGSQLSRPSTAVSPFGERIGSLGRYRARRYARGLLRGLGAGWRRLSGSGPRCAGVSWPPAAATALSWHSPGISKFQRMNMPSRTSQAVALTRADLVRPHSLEGDADAQRRLCQDMRFRPPPWLQPSIAARTRFVDEQVAAAIAAGLRQVVICGAGYDDRALRFRTTGVRFFELDHPATQDDKARLLAGGGRRGGRSHARRGRFPRR